MEELFVSFDGTAPYQVIIEADASAAYAYLLKNGQIVGDVWLFNVGAAPEEPPWRSGAEPPFANPREFVNTETSPWPVTADEFRVLTKKSESEIRFAVYLRGGLLAVLWEGAKPGKAAYARKDSPAANRLVGD